MGANVSSRADFEWVHTDQPHLSRRLAMLAKYPQIKKLMGHDVRIAYIVSAMVITQIFVCYLIKDSSFLTISLVAYFFGGVINHSMTLALHEIGHNLAFGQARPTANRLLGIWANLPIGVPTSVTFKKYHREHHRYLGVDGYDSDLPSRAEGKLFCNPLGKLVWLSLQPLFYALRPILTRPLPVQTMEILNWIVQLAFDVALVFAWGWRPLLYLIGGSIVTMGLHPMAGHFVAEHYTFAKGYETYSYYGPFNYITFNVGYHNEHHDFPNIPFTKLPELRKIAPEFYNTIPSHNSWLAVLWSFLFDPAIGPYARVLRSNAKAKADEVKDRQRMAHEG